MKRIICSVCSQILSGAILRVVVGLSLLACADLAFAQEAPSLADVARKEEARRKAQKRPTRVYTNADVRSVAPVTAATGTEAAATPKEGVSEGEADAASEGKEEGGTQAGASASASGGQREGAASAQAGGGPQVASAGLRPGVAAGDEAQWRSRMNTARDQVGRAQIQLEAMRTRVLNLQSARALGSVEASTQATLQRQQQDALEEFDRLRADIEKYQKALADLEAQAHKAGVPPGWLR